jgi:AhpD family alkylhydroperoxidase
MSQNPMMIVPGALQALQALQSLRKSVKQQGVVPWRTIDLVQLRVSQINGCSFCVEEHARFLREAGETDERLFAVAVWRDAPSFIAAERAALALTESVTRIADQADPVPDASLRRGRPALRRAGTGDPGSHDLHRQSLHPPRHRHPAGSGRNEWEGERASNIRHRLTR